MKLRNWLLVTYFIVMILPLVAAYILFAWIQSYNNDQKVSELFEKQIELEEIKSVLNEPSLYYPNANKEVVDELVNKERSITLYNPQGLVVYSSNPKASLHLQRERLYEDLFKIDQQFDLYSIKQPVFSDHELIGIFHVELARDEWVGEVTDRSIWMIVGFIVFFIVIYLIIIRLVNRKLNWPLNELMNEMTAFSSGLTVAETETKNDEVGQLKQHFYNMRNQINDAQKVIKEEQAEKEYMIASVSHDLKTPLTSIKAYAEALDTESKLTASEQEEYQKVIIDKSDFMKQMLDDLLTYTLLQSSTYEVEFVTVDGSEFFDMLVSDYEALCHKKQIQLNVLSNVTGLYNVNPKQMMRVADNLMSNAIKHTPHGHSIGLAAIDRQENLPEWLFSFVTINWDFTKNMYLIVQNEGAGISEQEIATVFDPLYQVDQARSKRNDHGTGLGLSITKQIMEKHGGDVQIISDRESGTCVVCTIPKADEEGEIIDE